MNFFCLGAAHLGINQEVLDVIRTYTSALALTPLHLGNLATAEEVGMYNRRMEKLATWTKIGRELKGGSSLPETVADQIVADAYVDLVEAGSADTSTVAWDDYLTEDGDVDELTPEDCRYLRWKLKAKVSMDQLSNQIGSLLDAQQGRINALLATLPDIKFLFGPDQALAFNQTTSTLGTRYWGTEFATPHLNILSMPANGDKVSTSPITPRSIRAIVHTKKSAIMPHPVSMTTSRPAPGLNNARNYFTTGGLSFPKEMPSSTKDIHKGMHVPGGVALYLEDTSFFADNVLVEFRHGGDLFIAEDGVVYTSSKKLTLPGKDTSADCADVHGPYQHYGVLNGMCYVARAMKSEELTVNGDMEDFESINRHAAGYPGRTEGKRLAFCLDGLRDIMDYIMLHSGGKRFTLIDSNHHEWLTDFVQKYPALKGLVDWPTLAKTRFSDWKILMREAGGNQLHSFGSLTYRHGDEESLPAAMEAMGDVSQGHWHRVYRLGWSGQLGCACHLGPSYLGNSLTAWQSQFATRTIYQGLTQSAFRTVLHDVEKKTSRFIFRGKVITVSSDKVA